MELPARAPIWATQLLDSLLAAGFAVGEERQGGMGGYSLDLTRSDFTVTMGGDRGEFDVTLAFSNPRPGRGRRASLTMPLEDYFAASRGDTDASFLLLTAETRNETASRWLRERVTEPGDLLLNEALLSHISVLQNARTRALFG
jgi:hypothetical protein